MAATDGKRRSAALQALTAAALALPGIAHAGIDGASLEYQHYQEGDRDLAGLSYSNLKLKPLQADSLSLAVSGTIEDRVELNLGYQQDTWSGATPVTTLPHAAVADQLVSGASRPSAYYTDPSRHPVDVDWSTYNGRTVRSTPDSRLVHVMASASPETRRQVDGKVGYAWDNTAVAVGGGVSDEPDYKSYFLNAGGSVDLNRKLTTLSWGVSYTISDIAASLEANSAADWGNYLDRIRLKNGVSTLFAGRHDSAVSMGATQIVDRDSLVSATLSYTRSSGYLSNPYKATVLAFDDPAQFIDSTGLRAVIVKGVLEQRPQWRNQVALEARYVRYVGEFDASLHLSYRFYHDDWGIDAHTFEAAWYQPLGDGWMLTPDLRYYTQTGADFYKPFFYFRQPFPILFPRNPELPPQIDFRKLRIDTFSSDERLSAFGTMNVGLTASKALRDDLQFQVGGEYAMHAGALALMRGEGSYADYDGYTLFASLKLDLARRSDAAAVSEADSGDGSGLALAPAGVPLPSGVQFARFLETPGQIAIALHHDYAIAGGQTQHGTDLVPDSVVSELDCGGQPCTRKVSGAYEHLTTLDVSYAPVEGLTLLVRPQFVDRHLDEKSFGFFFPGLGPFGNSGPSLHHTTGGIGDTGLAALATLWRGDGQMLGAGLGLSVPTGSVGKRVNTAEDYLSYGLQLGSGTWDVLPSLTYLGERDSLYWGGQLSAVWRPQDANDSGYALGDRIEGTAWGGYRIFDWLAASLRGVAASEGRIRGMFKSHVTPVQTGAKFVNGVPVPIYEYDPAPQTILGPMDEPASYGGRFFDVGVGLSATVPDGAFAGNRLNLEWLQPVRDDVNGYQVTRVGRLSLSWDIAF